MTHTPFLDPLGAIQALTKNCRPMTYGSLFTGIGGFDLALNRAGAKCSWQVEIDKNCQQVLAQQYPDVEKHSDVKTVGRHNLTAVDLICGGFPCQDLSVAGKRAGLAGERSGLWHEFHRIIAELRPQWVVIENVPGLLSSNKGRDFAVILRGLVECGYGVCWRVLDAQYFGVAQRRRRVFIVGSLGDGRAAEVLFEREGGAGDTPPSREAGKGIAHAISASPTATGRLDPNGEDFVYPINTQIATRGEALGEGTGFGIGDKYDPAFTIQANHSHAVAYTIQQNDGGDHRRQDRPNGGMYVNETDTALTVGSTDMTCISWNGDITPKFSENVSTTMKSEQGGEGFGIINKTGVRRLTPVECERLQGFPDGWTAGQADSTRYRQLGNAVAVPVVEWIARRIALCNTP